jgi:hypothetical protein
MAGNVQAVHLRFGDAPASGIHAVQAMGLHGQAGAGVVPRMAASNVSKVRKGLAAQLMLIGPKRRCSIGFHLEQPVG